MSDAPPSLEAVKNAVNALALPDVQRQTGSVPNIDCGDISSSMLGNFSSGAGHEASPRS